MGLGKAPDTGGEALAADCWNTMGVNSTLLPARDMLPAATDAGLELAWSVRLGVLFGYVILAHDILLSRGIISFHINIVLIINRCDLCRSDSTSSILWNVLARVQILN